MLKKIQKYLKSMDKMSMVVGIIAILAVITLKKKKEKENFDVGDFDTINTDLKSGDVIRVKDNYGRYLSFSSGGEITFYLDKKDDESLFTVIKSGVVFSFHNKKYNKYFSMERTSDDKRTYTQVEPSMSKNTQFTIYNNSDDQVSLKTSHINNDDPIWLGTKTDGGVTSATLAVSELPA